MPPNSQEAPIAGLRLETRTQGDDTIIRCTGRLSIENAEVFKSQGKAAILRSKRIVLDLGEVDRMDSAGLGALVGLYVSARKAQCEFLLINYSKPVRDLLGIAHLLSVFETCVQAGLRFP